MSSLPFKAFFHLQLKRKELSKGINDTNEKLEDGRIYALSEVQSSMLTLQLSLKSRFSLLKLTTELKEVLN